MRRIGALTLTGVVFVLMSACAPGTGGTGEPVSIPQVVVNCTTAQCKTDSSPYVFVTFTQSGCDNPGFAWQISGSTTINCTATSGCYGSIPSWVEDGQGTVARTIPSGTYDICGWIDYNRSWPNYPENDTRGGLLGQAIVDGSGAKIITSWQDP